VTRGNSGYAGSLAQARYLGNARSLEGARNEQRRTAPHLHQGRRAPGRLPRDLRLHARRRGRVRRTAPGRVLRREPRPGHPGGCVLMTTESPPSPQPKNRRRPWLRRGAHALAFTATLFVGVAIGMADDSAEPETGAASSELSAMQADLEEAQDERRELESQLEEVRAQRDTLKERLDEERAAAEQSQADPDEPEPEA